MDRAITRKINTFSLRMDTELPVEINPNLPKSLQASEENLSLVTFVNCTSRLVDLLWIDYKQKLVKYKTLKRMHGVKIDTYVGHPWVAYDSMTCDQLVINRKFVFYPVASNGAERKFAVITLPIFTLRQRAMQVVRDHAVSINRVHELFLPASVEEDLENLMDTKEWKMACIENFYLKDLCIRRVFTCK